MTFYIEMKKRKIFETYLNNIIKKSKGIKRPFLRKSEQFKRSVFEHFQKTPQYFLQGEHHEQ